MQELLPTYTYIVNVAQNILKFHWRRNQTQQL